MDALRVVPIANGELYISVDAPMPAAQTAPPSPKPGTVVRLLDVIELVDIRGVACSDKAVSGEYQKTENWRVADVRHRGPDTATTDFISRVCSLSVPGGRRFASLDGTGACVDSPAQSDPSDGFLVTASIGNQVAADCGRDGTRNTVAERSPLRSNIAPHQPGGNWSTTQTKFPMKPNHGRISQKRRIIQ